MGRHQRRQAVGTCSGSSSTANLSPRPPDRQDHPDQGRSGGREVAAAILGKGVRIEVDRIEPMRLLSFGGTVCGRAGARLLEGARDAGRFELEPAAGRNDVDDHRVRLRSDPFARRAKAFAANDQGWLAQTKLLESIWRGRPSETRRGGLWRSRASVSSKPARAAPVFAGPRRSDTPAHRGPSVRRAAVDRPLDGWCEAFRVRRFTSTCTRRAGGLVRSRARRSRAHLAASDPAASPKCADIWTGSRTSGTKRSIDCGRSSKRSSARTGKPGVGIPRRVEMSGMDGVSRP